MKKYQPSLSLRNYIDAYWSIQNNTSHVISLPIVPDGCMDIIYHKGEQLLVGAMSESFTVEMPTGYYSFGIRFKPSILPQILHINADNYLDKIVPLAEIAPHFCSDLLREDENEVDRVVVLNEYFETIFTNFTPHPLMQIMIQRVLLNQGNILLYDLINESGLSDRHIERLFKQWVGYTPKRFCNVMRFFAIFKEIIRNDITNFSLKAHEFGYCDQSHFNKEFKKFSQLSPTDEILSIFYKTNY